MPSKEAKTCKVSRDEADFLIKECSLEDKIAVSKAKIREARAIAEKKGMRLTVSFSGGKDSLVISDLAIKTLGSVPHLYSDTGLEMTSNFVRNYCQKRGVELIVAKPEMSFPQVMKKVGYPLFSKKLSSYIRQAQKKGYIKEESKGPRQVRRFAAVLARASDLPISRDCCLYLKERPLMHTSKNCVVLVGMKAVDSDSRRLGWLQSGCVVERSFDTKVYPIIFWTDDDVQRYLNQEGIKVPLLYHLGFERTGCFPCGYGSHIQRPNKFQLLRIWYPNLWYGTLYKWGVKKYLDFFGIPSGETLPETIIESYREKKLSECDDEEAKKEMEILIEKARRWEQENASNLDSIKEKINIENVSSNKESI